MDITRSFKKGIQMSQTMCSRCAKQAIQRRSYFATTNLQNAEESKLPRVANPSFWSGLIPKAFRHTPDPAEAAERARRRQAGASERRVGVIFMILGLLVGSNAIQIISIKRHMLDFSRKTDAKLSLLREVVQRVKNGEDVDVKKMLGTGEPQHEKEWEDVIRELENPDSLSESSRKREAKRVQRAEARELKDISEKRPDQTQLETGSTGQNKVSANGKSKFLL